MRAGVIVVALIVAGAGCGVPSSDGASTAARSEVPYGLLDPGETSTTTLPELATAPVRVWLVEDDRIVPVTRDVHVPLALDRALSALLTGPTAAEASGGLRSAVPTEGIGRAQVAAGVASIDLTTAFPSATPSTQLLALAQLVYTATEVAAVEIVTFTLDGQAIDVPRDDGSISNGPVTRFDYARLTGPADGSLP